MIYITGTKEISLKHTVVALGKFDGLHKGHQRLFSKLQKYAKEGYQTVVFTFDFHPMNLLSGKTQQLIYTHEERKKIIHDMGIDVLIEYPFTEETAHMLPESFIHNVLIKAVDAKIIVVGDDFRFGYQRKGDVPFLKQYESLYGYKVDHCTKLCVGDEEVSSTRIRKMIKDGQMKQVWELLDRPYSVTGKVIHGKANGRTVGMPTANIAPENEKLLPPDGVYATVTELKTGEKYYSLTNIGKNPTVGANNALRVETFLLNFNGSLYTEEITVKFYEKIRGEFVFPDLTALRKQVDQDQKAAIQIFEKYQV